MRRVALITHDLGAGGGCGAITAFLHKILTASRRYAPEIFSLATSAVDPWSVRIVSPRTWWRGVQVAPDVWRGMPFHHVGAVATELEFQRYRPRRVLDTMLERFDLLQFVTGIAAWGCVAQNLHHNAVALYVASMVHFERSTRLSQIGGIRRGWLRCMTPITACFERRALAAAECVFAISRYTYDRLSPFVEPGRLVMGPVGVDTEVFKPASSPPSGYLLSVGRFSDHRKNVRLLVTAYADLCLRQPSIPPLVLAGERPSQSDLQHLTKLNLEGRVRILGYVRQEVLPDLYRDAGLFVLSSDEEGLGIGIMEAMATGLPVVSTRCGGPQTVIEEGETGLMVPVGDARAMSDALERVIMNPTLAHRMGRAGRARAEQQFSLTTSARVVFDRYDALLGG